MRGELGKVNGGQRVSTLKFRNELWRQAGSVLWGSFFGIVAKEIAAKSELHMIPEFS